MITEYIRDHDENQRFGDPRTGILENDDGRLELDLEKVAEIEIVTDDAFKV